MHSKPLRGSHGIPPNSGFGRFRTGLGRNYSVLGNFLDVHKLVHSQITLDYVTLRLEAFTAKLKSPSLTALFCVDLVQQGVEMTQFVNAGAILVGNVILALAVYLSKGESIPAAPVITEVWMPRTWQLNVVQAGLIMAPCPQVSEWLVGKYRETFTADSYNYFQEMRKAQLTERLCLVSQKLTSQIRQPTGIRLKTGRFLERSRILALFPG
jgi:hypothetical protein